MSTTHKPLPKVAAWLSRWHVLVMALLLGAVALLLGLGLSLIHI